MSKRGLWSTCELTCYFAVYIAYITIGLWKLYAVRDQVLKSAHFEFDVGWSILQRPRDDSNDELENFSSFFAKTWHWYVTHALISAFTTTRRPAWNCYGHAAVCVLALLTTLTWSTTVLLAILIATFYIASFCRLKRIIWLLAAIWMIIINLIKENQYWYQSVGYTEYFTLIIILSWSLLRCCSYALTRISDSNNDKTQSLYTLPYFLGYTLYFPCLVYGPLLGYNRYVVQMQQWRPVELKVRIYKFLWELFRVCFWWLVMQFCLHYLYIHYMARDVSTIGLVGSVFWQHAAGYFMGQFFFLYYVVTYGLGIAFAYFDGLNPPQRPRCIGRIHFYSDMWKYFDEGLYEFLFKHIYAELCSKRSSVWAKIISTAITFSFVYVWHGCYTYVLIWSVLNYLCLGAEKIFKSLTSSSSYKEWTLRYFGVGGTQRLNALLATQLFIPAAFSNVYFISGQEVGQYLMRGAYLSGFWNYLALSFCSYCFFQCSEVLLKNKKKVS